MEVQCNGYRYTKWNRRYDFWSWTKLFVLHFALISFRKALIHLFFEKLTLNSRRDWVLNQGNLEFELKIDILYQSHGRRVVGLISIHYNLLISIYLSIYLSMSFYFHQSPPSLSLSLYIYIYIYMYSKKLNNHLYVYKILGAINFVLFLPWAFSGHIF